MRGVSTAVPGLFFCGIQFQYAGSSMLIQGAGRDGAYVAGRIAERHLARSRTRPEHVQAA
jgi:putative flavoprotein involved in K+ transport